MRVRVRGEGVKEEVKGGVGETVRVNFRVRVRVTLLLQ
jgi:hypothetical protein